MGKQLAISNLKDEVSAYDEYVEFDVNSDSETYTVKMYPFFKPEKIRDLIEDMINFAKKCEEEKIKINDKDEDDLVGFFILKHFTNIKFTKSKKAKKLYEEFKIALNAKMFGEILKAFPEQSILDVQKMLYDHLEMSVKAHKTREEFQERIKGLELENREVFEQFANKQKIESESKVVN
jgi:hypothetical protein